jgi:hypothetical protein
MTQEIGPPIEALDTLACIKKAGREGWRCDDPYVEGLAQDGFIARSSETGPWFLTDKCRRWV